MIVFRRRPPNEYNQIKDDGWGLLHYDSLQVHWNDLNGYQKTEHKPGTRKLRGFSRDLLQPLSIIASGKLKFKNRSTPLSNIVHDSEGDTATADSSQVSVGRHHGLSGASNKSIKDKEETKIIHQTLHHSSKQTRNQFAYDTDMTSTMVPRDCRDESNYTSRNYQSAESLPSVQSDKPQAHHLHDPASDPKDSFASFVSGRSKCSQRRMESSDIPMEKEERHFSCLSTIQGVQPDRPKAHNRHDTPPHPKEAFASIVDSTSSRSKCSQWRSESLDIRMEEEEERDLPCLSIPKKKDHPDDFEEIRELPRQCCPKETNPKDYDAESFMEVGDLPPLTISVATKQRLRMEEYNIEVGDLPPLAIPIWAKQRVKLASRSSGPTRSSISLPPSTESNFGSDSKDDEEYPFDETAEINPFRNSIRSNIEKYESDPFDCYYDADAALSLSTHPQNRCDNSCRFSSSFDKTTTTLPAEPFSNKCNNNFHPARDAIDSSPEKVGQDDTKVPVLNPPMEGEKARAETTNYNTRNDDDNPEERHLVATEGYPSDEDGPMAEIMVGPRNENIFDSAIKFVEAFTANLDGYHYEINYPNHYIV